MPLSRYATKLTDGAFSYPVAGLRLPDRTYLVGEYVLGGSEAESVKNRADPDNPLTVQGAPTYNAHSVIVRSSATVGFGFQTGIVPDEGHTLIVVRKNAATASAPAIVGMASAVVGLWGPRQFGADNYFSTGESSSTQGPKRPRPASAAEVYFECAVHSPKNLQYSTGGYGSMYWYAGGARQTNLSAFQTTVQRIEYRQYVIGTTGLTDSITTNNLEVYFVGLYNKPLTPAGIDAAHDAIVAYYAALGVTVV